MRGLLFSIDRIETAEGGEALVVGSCCCDLMKAGDQAHLIVFRTDDGRFERSEPITVQFSQFEVHGRLARELEPGQTAGIRLPYDVARGLRFGWYLLGENA